MKTDKALKNLTAPFDKSKLDSEDKDERELHRKRYNWHLKQKTIFKKCKQSKINYQFVTDKQIRCQRMDNIKDLFENTPDCQYSDVWINITGYSIFN